MLPTFRAPIPDVEVWFDTSGSMDNSEIAQGMNELVGVLRAVGGEVVVGSIDAAIHGKGKVLALKDAKKYMGGGGGTDFSDFFEDLARRQKMPHLIAFVTDGDAGGVPDAPPKGCDFIWLMTSKRKPPCSWGTVIHIGE
jgi:predicted metal-dependent peptidase